MSGASGPVTFRFLGGPDAGSTTLLSCDNSADYFRSLTNGNGCRFPNGARALLIENGSDEELLLSLIWGLAL
jgi:hypothetical protein